jgi:hypothetical protein
MPLVFYRCSKCGKEFGSFDDAKRHEDSHLVPVSAEAASYTAREFPYEINVEFNDGSKRVYCARDLGGDFEGGDGNCRNR